MLQENNPLSHQIASLLKLSNNDDWALIEGMGLLAAAHGNDVYDEFFHVLTEKRFGPDVAISHWNSVISHRESIITTSYLHQGLLPAIIHYLQKEAGVISNPRFFESDYIENIKRSSITDGLTGLYNQTFFKNALAKMISQLRRHSGPALSVVLFDLDRFKQYNDTLGHLAGDLALKSTAAIIKKNLRESDIAARYGGEEFALLLPHTSKVMAQKVAHRIRQSIERKQFPGQELTPSGNLTVSGGVAEFDKDTDNIEALIEAADRELYKAKIRRNCICPAEDERRRGIRRPVRSLVECSHYDESRFLPVLSMNISEVGVALGCDKGFEVGTPLKLRFKKPFWTYDIDLTATVRQCHHTGDMSFVGMEFDGGFSGDLDTFRADLLAH